MAQVHIRHNDITSLSQKLSALEPELTEPERALLLLLISFAARGTGADIGATAEMPGSHDRERDIPVFVVEIDETRAFSIHDQFANAFTPGAVGRYRLEPGSYGPGPAPF
jgi:hypothetical protein